MIYRLAHSRGWRIMFFFDEERGHTDDILSLLAEHGAPPSIMDKAEKMLVSSSMNNGFTYSNPDIRSAIIWIGPQTNGEEWINTTIHELFHIAMAISREKKYAPFSEQPAYTIGELVEQVSDILCSLGCDKCRHRSTPNT